ncbi:MAG: polysaccharide deacetylase family protein [Sulfuricaulis sp.]
MSAIKRSLQHLIYVCGIAQTILKTRAGAPMILMYHGVTVNDSLGLQNCEGKHVPSGLFIEQLRFLAKYRNIISLTDMVEGIRRGDDLCNSVALTFDDGYENNYTVAARILSDFNMSATFFLATGYIGVNRWMWTDRIEHALDRSDRTNITIPGPIGSITLATPTDKMLALRRIKAYLKQQPRDNCESYACELENNLDLSEIEPVGDYRFMNWTQAKELAASGFEVGAHTVNHPILSQIDRVDALNEILSSRDSIRAEVDKCSMVFCYPNGKTTDYTAEIMAICQTHFHAALSTNRGPVRRAELFELNRIGVSRNTTPSRLAWSLVRER